MQFSNRELEDYLLFGKTLLTNISNHPVVRERILEDGYDDTHFEQGTNRLPGRRKKTAVAVRMKLVQVSMKVVVQHVKTVCTGIHFAMRNANC